ncbi:sugar phosphate isomerase/epimerase [Halieaceae bacterium IMCC14734]|uniref:Sugar phosphate isomerase/epimerase n=1 Tax=Candidatus Litorirhabdus singularis TaxID=2518993 RepID=A0ABT3TCX4_9GAMM|nr:sugar phosphate isomerase/epimerase [Candidatus Litorirhabdus singularis]MCX2979670.1 sugar phosphate isomerase/epimerase [Candidatus Litorirhabdus singularis]
MQRRAVIRYAVGAILPGLAGINLTACQQGLEESTAMNINHPETSATADFPLSLAQWSLHRALWAGDLDHLDFAATARRLDIGAVEYVNQFFADKAEDAAYLEQMNGRAVDHDIRQLLIMVDGEGNLAGDDTKERQLAISNHHKWVHAAARLGCHSIRVNAAGKGDAEDVAKRAVDSLTQLASYAAQENINILVENHGGHSSSGAWLAGVMAAVNLPNCGTLPDFGNFTMAMFPPRKYDRYLGVEELMPWAMGVSAKTYDFDSQGEETTIDIARMLGIVKASGFKGHIGIEYEGSRLSEEAGIRATRDLLLRNLTEVQKPAH